MFKALIVDDEPQIRKGLRTIIPWESYGFTVVGEAADGLEALRAAREQQPDLVITDVKMPGMGGMELSRELKAERPELQVLVLSGYNEFAFAKEAMQYGVADYLLKPVDPAELTRSLERVYDQLWNGLQERMQEKEKAGRLKDYFLNKLIRGEIYGHPVQEALKYEVQLIAESFAVVVISIDRYGEFLLSLPGEEIGWRRYAIGNVIQELLPANGYLFDVSEQQFGVLLASGPEEKGVCDLLLRRARSFAELAAESVARYAKEQVTMGVGEVVRKPEDIRHAYRTALQALEMKFYSDAEFVFVYELSSDAIDRAGSGTLPWDDAGLFPAIRDGAEDRLRSEIDRLLVPLYGKPIAKDTLKFAVVSTIIRLAKMTEEFHGEWQSFYTGKFGELERILEKGSLKQLNAFLLALGLQIAGHIDTLRTRKMDGRVREMLDHIEQHYSDDLNLKELSKLFFVNTVYLGQLFKKETGEYFNDYINKVRVGHACRLLKETGLSAAEIAERVGYKYVDHFYRQFKLLHGMNPGEFRRQSQRPAADPHSLI
ncbi:response regulator transcription factor [Paenibacillus koleovorans]|uniref:response regulator transcription factor n=1 Tax=Paenibacillus koleovorans TaxID=121608 RepID=UPI000FD8CA64|nr:response regulator transcription factor [Paenibacillus koleovorans]